MPPAPRPRSELVDGGLYWVRTRDYSPDGHPDWTIARYEAARRHWRVPGVDHHWCSTRDLAEIGPFFAVEPPSSDSDESGPLDAWNGRPPSAR
jgi:hypothetical protein